MKSYLIRIFPAVNGTFKINQDAFLILEYVKFAEDNAEERSERILLFSKRTNTKLGK